MIDYEMEKFRSLEKGFRKLLTHVRCQQLFKSTQLERQLYSIQLNIFVSNQCDNLLFRMIILNTSRYTDHLLFKPIFYPTI